MSLGSLPPLLAGDAAVPQHRHRVAEGQHLAKLVGDDEHAQAAARRQVAHHVPDSHMNAYTRLKLALTEQEPTIKPYDEARWAELEDAKAPIDVSLALLASLHDRWIRLFRSLKPEQFARTFRHPEHPGALTVDWLLFQYAWHGRHHTAHITELRKQKGW